MKRRTIMWLVLVPAIIGPVLVYCPPENHNGRWGHIAFADGHIEVFMKEEFDRILAGYGVIRLPQEP